MAYPPLKMEGLTPEMENVAERELGETPQVRKDSLEKIKELIENEPDFYPCLDDKFLLMFLRCKKHDVQRAFKSLKRYYCFKEKYSGVFTDLLPTELRNIMKTNCYVDMPRRDHHGRNVVIWRLSQCLRTKIPIEKLFAACLTVGILANRIEATSVCGIVLIFDFKDFSLQEIFKFASPKFVMFFFNCIQECLPFRIREVHIVNEPELFNVFYNIIKFAMPKKLMERVFMHGKNLKDLQKYLPPEILPEELEGTAGPLDSTEFYNNALSQECFFKEMVKCGFRRKSAENLQERLEDKFSNIII
ncbi:alpha-tocopherol transfer protein-like [Stegodyphus dumicola]|uniref:alpha-tocopherol transfer protein-like n=1 Tax=Stegodyphus dumicola TaxID=202533 RepID=UPI0015A9E352|nr:alpha-tocopherol transfer protein-like [Stegodyphus dumicola]